MKKYVLVKTMLLVMTLVNVLILLSKIDTVNEVVECPHSDIPVYAVESPDVRHRKLSRIQLLSVSLENRL